MESSWLVRRPAVAGAFYPAGGDELESMLDTFFSEAVARGARPDPSVRGLICPHAGYVYSGAAAACAYARLSPSGRNRVVVMAPSHSGIFRGVSVWPRGSYQTPLGEIPVDEEACSALRESLPRLCTFVPEAHAVEHSLEVQLPFLQHVLRDGFTLVPILFGGLSDVLARGVAEALDALFGGDSATILVASTDLSHYHPAVEAERMDSACVSLVESCDPDGLWCAYRRSQVELCGLMPVLAVLWFARARGAHVEVVEYTHSGRVTGDMSAVVGYMSAVVREAAAERE